MNETARMCQDIRKITLILAVLVSGISTLIFQGYFQTIGVGILIGALMGIIGFNMINTMASRLELYGNVKAKGYQSYVRRYALYTVVFALAAYKGVHIIALLIGMLCHKAAILIYVFLHRKEVD